MKRNEHETKFKDLSNAIVNALINDETVMAQLEQLRDRHIIEPGALLGMALKVTELLEISGVTISDDEKKALSDSDKPQKTKAKSQDTPKKLSSAEARETIDGRDLSANEVQFQEWVSEKFDAEEWLKKTGLIW
ncbi:hypothetical protein MNBD_NITROSPINAE01-783 [hydrothermal vent metagenome]|uniref:Uncharacterized protein n=1 Tax=hydrothermal vent metagenome TaxID=652676 RepID=A0A3B1CUW0_9ZZZZ